MLAYILIPLSWLVFILYWAISARGTKKTVRRDKLQQEIAMRLIFVLALILASSIPSVRTALFKTHGLASMNTWVEAISIILCMGGIAFAIWARIYLGKNWGMPMSVKESPELVTRGPYRYVRHPIYTGMIVAIFGSILTGGLIWLVMWLYMLVYFSYAAKEEEKLLEKQFPDQYPAYRARTRMLIPFVF
jgi:protein-S-isoprenylcysteine O-methyltransferase Ste14